MRNLPYSWKLIMSTSVDCKHTTWLEDSVELLEELGYILELVKHSQIHNVWQNLRRKVQWWCKWKRQVKRFSDILATLWPIFAILLTWLNEPLSATTTDQTNDDSRSAENTFVFIRFSLRTALRNLKKISQNLAYTWLRTTTSKTLSPKGSSSNSDPARVVTSVVTVSSFLRTPAFFLAWYSIPSLTSIPM